MALAISFISEDKKTFVVAFDGKPSVGKVVETIEHKMNENGVMTIVEWYIGFNMELDHEYGKELAERINKIY